MKDQDKDREDIISRRQFFKRAAGAALPFLALTSISSALSSCEIDDPDNPYGGGIPGGGSGGSSGKGSGSATCGTITIDGIVNATTKTKLEHYGWCYNGNTLELGHSSY